MEARSRQVQIELFSGSGENINRMQERHNSFFSVNLSAENIIFVVILCIMLVVLSFSLGVEKGRKFSVKDPAPVVVNKVSAPAVSQAKNNFAGATPAKTVVKVVKKYTIQVASLEKQASVEKEVSKLKTLGHEAWAVSRGKYSIICVGRFASKEEAEAYKANLPKKYHDCFSRRI